MTISLISYTSKSYLPIEEHMLAEEQAGFRFIKLNKKCIECLYLIIYIIPSNIRIHYISYYNNILSYY